MHLSEYITKLKKHLAILTIITFVMQPSVFVFANPTATADTTASANNQPDVREETSNNGNQVTVVDIQGPNASGLSHNKYLDFNVGPNGLILNNNILGPTNTTLLNNLQINPNLQGTAASIILNEITGPTPSFLNGTLEVGGNKAAVIIANPNGISGSSFGFINTDRITLTTGTPIINGADLTFNVERGKINIYGDGLVPDAQNRVPSKLDILTRATQINAELWADQELNIITGTNQINYQTLEVEAQTSGQGTVPALALDVKALGGMYAGKIKLIGTEQGLGVNIQGEIYSTSDLTLTNEGKITLKTSTIQQDGKDVTVGNITAAQDLKITSTDKIIIYQDAQIASKQNIELTGKNIINAGFIYAGAVEIADEEEGEVQQPAIPSDLKLTATEKITSTGKLGANNQVQLTAPETNYEKQDILTDNLLENGQTKDLTEQPPPTTPSTPDDHAKPTLPNSPTIDQSTLISKQDDQDLNLTADRSKGVHTIIDKTNSGIDLVQIATASKDGVSRNLYTDFNIKSSGLILNNATTYTNTKLGGWINKNPLLDVSAKIILNEITSTNPSQLNGFLEVAGDKAAVIIANPNGISINGLGFINTSDIALNTNNANLVVQGEGINASTTNNLALNTQNLINNASEIYANNLNINTNLQLTNNGRIITSGDIEITTTNLQNKQNSLISSKKNLNIKATNTIENDQAVITTDGNINIQTKDLKNTNNTAIFSQSDLTLNATNQLTNDDSLIAVDSETTITAKNIDNLNNSLIYSNGDLTLNAQQDILNQSASLESKTNITIKADNLTNEKSTFQTDWTTTYQNISYAIKPIDGHYKAERKFQRKIQTGTILNETASGQILADGNITITTNNKLTNHYSVIAAGGALTINTDTLENHGYQGTTINTDTGTDTHHWKKKKKSWGGLKRKWKYGKNTYSYYAQEEIDTNTSRLALLSAGSTNTINASTVENKVYNAGGNEPTGRTNDKPYYPNIIDQILTNTNSTLTINNQIFKQTTNPNANYLIETDPRFTNKKQFLSSDYLYQRVKSDPDKISKRLGDGYYEQKLITEQITALTGRKYTSTYNNELDQYKALMNNAIVFAAEFNLSLGVKLTKQQMAALTTDIVWLEEKEVDGQKVLVPVVYLASLKQGDMLDSGAVIIGSDVEIFAKDDLTNKGSLKADKALKLKATNITNKLGKITGQDLNITAEETITNQSGLIKGNNLDLQAQNITNQTLTKKQEYGNLDQTTILDTAGIVAENNLTLTAQDKISNQGAILSAGSSLDLTAKDIEITSITKERHVAMTPGTKVKQDDIEHQGSYLLGGNTTINADNNLTIKGSTVAAKEDLSIKANNIEIEDVKDYSYSDVTAGRKGSFYYERNQHEIETVVASELVAGKNINIQSSTDILIKGSNIESEEGKITLKAENNVNIVSETQYQQTQYEMQYKSSGFLSKKKTTIYDYKDLESQVGSNISGNQIQIQSGNDTNILASNVVATKDVTINAQGNINIESQEQTDSNIYEKKVKKSGLLSGGGLGFSIGTEKKKDKYTNQNITQVGSTVGSLESSVTLNAGQDVNIKASDIIAKEDINIEGNTVNILSEDHIYSYQESHEYKKTGFTFSLGGTVGSMVNNTYSALKRSSEASDDRLKYMGAIKGGFEVYKGRQAQAKAYADNKKILEALDEKLKNGEIDSKEYDGKVAKAKDQLKDNLFQISIGFGTSKWSSKKDGQTIVSQGSNIIAEKDVTIIAREQDLNIKGSNIEGENITLQAQENVNIEAGQTSNVSKTDSKNSSSGVSVNVGIGTGNILSGGINVSKGKGKIRENSTVKEESTVTAKNELVIKSGEDLNIIGSTVAGDKVEIQVGGNLNIETLQDTDDYYERNKQTSGGLGVSVKPGGGLTPDISYGKTNQKINSEYQSNQEQAGIFAGKQGFDIYVEGNTDLKGAVISSKADEEDNKLSTGTLTFEDLYNHAEYEAKTDKSGATISGGKLDPLGTILGTLPTSGGGSEGKADSVTKSAVDKGEIEVRDQDKQEQDLDELSRDTSTANNPLDKIFDRDKVLERQEAAAMFGEMAFNLIGDYSRSQYSKYKELANNEQDPDKRKDYEREMSKWAAGGEYKLLLHGLAGGIMAEINNGDFGQGVTVGVVNELLVGLIIKNNDKLGLSKDSVKAISNKIGELLDGNQGGAIAESATENNHDDKEIKAQDSVKEGKYTYIDSSGVEQTIIIPSNKEAETFWDNFYKKAGEIYTTLDQINDGFTFAVAATGGIITERYIDGSSYYIVLVVVGSKTYKYSKYVPNLNKLEQGSSEIKNIYSSIKEAPKYPSGFTNVQNGLKKVSINNVDVLDNLKKIEPGEWNKVYRNGFDANGKKITIHYFEHKNTGKVFDVKTYDKWSNW